MVIIWSKFGVQKKANLDQIITINICARTFCFKKNVLKPLFLCFIFDKQCLKTNLDQIITTKDPKLGPDSNYKNPNLDQIITPQHAYIY